ncbi:MAG: peptidylprolyl isomerase [Mycobacterium sp.]
MPTNEQRRATAKRKLQRQLERRAEKARKRRQLTIIGLAVAAVLAIAAVATVVVLNRDTGDVQASADTPTATSVDNRPLQEATGQLPPFVAAPDLGSNCVYTPTSEPAAKPVDPPNGGQVPTEPAEISVSMATDQGNIGLSLDNAKAPCTVNSFASLAQKGYFDDTPCHRLTNSEQLSVLQCGDPSGSGSGGPGYAFANEYPTDQYRADDPAAQQPVIYPRGTLAMAHSSLPDSNGSQFFLVYQDSQLPPQYTAFGMIDQTGLATLEKIAAAGIEGGADDGAPATPVMVTSIALD